MKLKLNSKLWNGVALHSRSAVIITIISVWFNTVLGAVTPLVVYDFDNIPGLYEPRLEDSRLTAGALSGGPGITNMPDTNSAMAVEGRSLYLSNLPFYSLDEESAKIYGRWFEFTLELEEDFEANITAIGFYVLRRAFNESGEPEGNGAPQAYSVLSSANGFTTSLGSGSVPLAADDSFSQIKIDLANMPGLSNVAGSIQFRIVFWSPEGTGSGPNDRQWRLDELTLEGAIQKIADRPICEGGFYVAPHGNDDNPGTEALPFATLRRARDAVRAMDCRLVEDLVIYIEPGDYFLQEPLFLGVEDSGRDGFRIVYRGTGSPGTARLIGGFPVEQWEPVDGRVFRAPILAGTDFNTLYENGVRAEKARFPSRQPEARFPASAAPYLRSERGTRATLTWKPGDLDEIAPADLVGATLVVWPWGYQDWAKIPRQIASFDRVTRMIEVEELAAPIQSEARYFLEGRLEFLNTPGEFHLDREGGYLYYWPRFGDPSEQEIIAPQMRQIVVLEGLSAALPVRDIVIEGLQLAFTDAFPYVEGTTVFSWSESSSGPYGVVHLRYADNVELIYNHILGAGLNGIYLERSNKENRIYGNLIEEIGVSGIVLAYHRQASQFPLDSNDRNRIENNRIRGLGAVAVDSAGINIWGGRNNLVRFCEISDGARYAVSLRGPFSQWAPGTDPADTLNNTNRPLAENNRIEFSHFHRMVQDSGDAAAVQMAGISSLSVFPVNFLEQLLIENIEAHPTMFDVPPNGIFFDYTEGVIGQVIRNVEVRGTPNAFRANRTDFGHTYENVSWKAGFDSQMMYYSDIGLRSDFPEEYRIPPELIDITVKEVSNGDTRMLVVNWGTEDRSPPVDVVISAEGVVGYLPVEVPPGEYVAQIERPVMPDLVNLRLRARGPAGAMSQGVLVPAAEPPELVESIDSTGVPGGVDLSWKDPADGHGYRLHFLNISREPVDLGADIDHYRVDGLDDDEIYDLRIDVQDADGHFWKGSPFRVTAGVRQPPPSDYVAWWTFDEIDLNGIIPDNSGSGHTLKAGAGRLGYADGVFGRSVVLDGQGTHLVYADASELSIGMDSYAVSLWIRKTPSTNMAGRVLNFGGGSRGVFEHWRLDAPDPVPGLEIFANDYSLGAVLHDGTRAYSAASGGVRLAGNWIHLVVNIERDGFMSLWVNGEPLAQTPIDRAQGSDIRSDFPLVLGKSARLDHQNLYWHGRIDQVKIYDRSLSRMEISNLYDESPRGPFLPGTIEPIEGAWFQDRRFGNLFGAEAFWSYSPSMGWIELGAFPWIYHSKLGWIIYLLGNVGEQVWLYHPQINWIVVPDQADGTYLYFQNEWKSGSFF
jgi:parallel beta-helix repeat protein